MLLAASCEQIWHHQTARLQACLQACRLHYCSGCKTNSLATAMMCTSRSIFALEVVQQSELQLQLSALTEVYASHIVESRLPADAVLLRSQSSSGIWVKAASVSAFSLLPKSSGTRGGKSA